MKRLTTFMVLMLAFGIAGAQTKKWSLQDCLDYALENNIQLHQTQNDYLSGLEDTKKSKAQLYPTLSASTTQTYGAKYYGSGSGNSYSGTYGINSNWTLYQGGKLKRSIKLNSMQNQQDSLYILEKINDIKIAIVQAYMRCLYASEAIKISESTMDLAIAERDRAIELWKAGNISKVDVAQLESQVYADKSDVVTAKANLETYRTQLKELLELGITDEIELEDIEVTEEQILKPIKAKSEIYDNALAYLPEVKVSQISIETAELSVKQAKAGYIPTIGMSAGIGTNNMSGLDNNFSNQFKNNFALDAGVVLSIPISQQRAVKTEVNKAQIALINSKLNRQSVEKQVMEEVESSYLDVVSSQAQYVAACEQEKYAQESYTLTDEQFSLGMKNTVEVIAAKNTLLNAQLSRVQSKFMVLLNQEIIEIYQGNR